LRALVWQTDNGSEFIGGHDPRGHPTGFPTALGDSQQERIPPAAPTFQSDETVHRLVEDEFFGDRDFAFTTERLASLEISPSGGSVFRATNNHSTVDPGHHPSLGTIMARTEWPSPLAPNSAPMKFNRL